MKPGKSRRRPGSDQHHLGVTGRTRKTNRAVISSSSERMSHFLQEDEIAVYRVGTTECHLSRMERLQPNPGAGMAFAHCDQLSTRKFKNVKSDISNLRLAYLINESCGSRLQPREHDTTIYWALAHGSPLNSVGLSLKRWLHLAFQLANFLEFLFRIYPRSTAVSRLASRYCAAKTRSALPGVPAPNT